MSFEMSYPRRQEVHVMSSHVLRGHLPSQSGHFVAIVAHCSQNFHLRYFVLSMLVGRTEWGVRTKKTDKHSNTMERKWEERLRNKHRLQTHRY